MGCQIRLLTIARSLLHKILSSPDAETIWERVKAILILAHNGRRHTLTGLLRLLLLQRDAMMG